MNKSFLILSLFGLFSLSIFAQSSYLNLPPEESDFHETILRLEELRGRLWTMESDGIDYNVYSVCEENLSINTYFYSNEKGEIIFEVGEIFNWLDEENSTKEELLKEEVDFLSFVDSYKPIVKEVVSQEIAKKWLKQATKLEKLISDNTMKVCGCGREKKGPSISSSGPKINMIYKKFR